MYEGPFHPTVALDVCGPEGPSTQCFRTLAPKTRMALGTRILSERYPGPRAREGTGIKTAPAQDWRIPAPEAASIDTTPTLGPEVCANRTPIHICICIHMCMCICTTCVYTYKYVCIYIYIYVYVYVYLSYINTYFGLPGALGRHPHKLPDHRGS